MMVQQILVCKTLRFERDVLDASYPEQESEQMGTLVWL
jgi:hypothetical protein